MKRELVEALKVVAYYLPGTFSVISTRFCPTDEDCGDKSCEDCWKDLLKIGDVNMTNKTMEILERLFIVQMLGVQDNSLLLEVATALSKFRASGKPADEAELRQTAENYIKEISRRVIEREEEEV